MSFKLLKYLILGSLVIVTGCAQISVQSKNDLFPYVGKRVAFFVVSPSPTISPKLWNTLRSKMEERFSQFESFQVFMDTETLEATWEEQPLWKRRQHRYSATLALAGVSDKDLSRRLEEHLNVDQFLVVQFEEFPCTEECPASSQLFMRLQLVDATTSEIIWRARIAHQLEPEELEPEAFVVLSVEITEQMLELITNQFIVPWHRWRYENLKKVASS